MTTTMIDAGVTFEDDEAEEYVSFIFCVTSVKIVVWSTVVVVEELDSLLEISEFKDFMTETITFPESVEEELEITELDIAFETSTMIEPELKEEELATELVERIVAISLTILTIKLPESNVEEEEEESYSSLILVTIFAITEPDSLFAVTLEYPDLTAVIEDDIISTHFTEDEDDDEMLLEIDWATVE